MGRPPKYSTLEEFETVVDEYFTHCDNRIRYVYSKKRDDVVEMIDPEPYTMSGLAYALGFLCRETLLEYGKRDLFSDAVKRARLKVQTDVERRLMEGGGVGPIFSLKNNFGWKDKSEQDITSNGETISFTNGVPRPEEKK